MTHSGAFDREYYCHHCGLMYCGFFDPLRGGREGCPSCGKDDPCAVDTIAHAYCGVNLSELAERRYPGRDPFAETGWWREQWTRPEWHDLYRTFSWGHRHNPEPEVMHFWNKALARSMRSRLAWGARKKGSL